MIRSPCRLVAMVACSLLIVAIISGVESVTEITTKTLPSPFLAWSGREGENIQLTNDVSEVELKLALRGLFGLQTSPTGSPSILSNLPEQPEFVVIFLEPVLSTDQFLTSTGAHAKATTQQSVSSFSKLRQYMDESESVAVPFLSLQTDQSVATVLTSVLVDFFQASPTSTLCLLESTSSPLTHFSKSIHHVKTFSSQHKLISFLELQPILLSNGIPDVLVVSLPATTTHSDDDASIHSIITSLKSLSSDYVSIFSSALPLSKTITFIDHDDSYYVSDFSLRGEAAPDSTGNYTTWFPPAVAEGLIISFILLIILFVGMCCTCYIQTPDRFPTPSADPHHNHNMLYPGR